MLNVFSIVIGGGIGAVARYLVGILYLHILKTNLPAATFCVNFVGCLTLGFLYIFFIEKTQIPTNIKLALTVGFCGGLTTFSTFSLEIFEMIQNSHYVQALVYIAASLVLGIAAVFLGGYLCKTFII